MGSEASKMAFCSCYDVDKEKSKLETGNFGINRPSVSDAVRDSKFRDMNPE